MAVTEAEIADLLDITDPATEAALNTDEMELQKASAGDSGKISLRQVPVLGGVLVEKTAIQSYGNGVTANIDWDQAEYDSDSFFDGGGDVTRLTIPTGITRVMAFCSVQWQLFNPSSGYIHIQPIKSSGGLPGMSLKRINVGTPAFDNETIVVHFASAPFVVTATDYLYISAYNGTAVTREIEVSPYTYFGLMVLERSS